MKRGERGRLRWAILTSLAAHVGVVALLWVAARNVEAIPKMRVYAVDIVSPPPQLEGEPNPGGGGEPVPEEATPEPEPEPEPPAPEPTPAPPKAEPAPAKREPAPPKKEPSPPPEATKKPEPAKPAPKAEKPAEKPAERPKQTAGGGTGEGSGASRGARPEATSTGGEGLDVHLKGVQCPSPEYCANIVRQLYRYFRPPANASGDAAEVFFWINRDGSVSEIKVARSSGSFRFQVAAMEAVEQAGLNKAFGPLPRAFQLDRLPVSFYFRPAR